MEDPTQAREDLLAELVRADLAQRPERRPFRVPRLGGRSGQALIRHPKLGDESVSFMHAARQDIEDLVAKGLIHRIPNREYASKGQPASETWELNVTDKGFEHVRQR